MATFSAAQVSLCFSAPGPINIIKNSAARRFSFLRQFRRLTPTIKPDEPRFACAHDLKGFLPALCWRGVDLSFLGGLGVYPDDTKTKRGAYLILIIQRTLRAGGGRDAAKGAAVKHAPFLLARF